ncbi:hypothetical protein D9M68_310880 [compost metagenome]
MSKPLKCYFAGSCNPDEHVYVDACFAHSHREAKKLLWKHGSEIQQECDWRYFDMRVARQSQFDGLAPKFGVMDQGVVHRDDIQRQMGWRCEGDSQCSACDLAEFDGKWPVCEECRQCSECGHDDDCQEREEPSHG